MKLRVNSKGRSNSTNGHYLTVVSPRKVKKEMSEGTEYEMKQNRIFGSKKKRYIRVFSIDSQPGYLTTRRESSEEEGETHETNIVEALKKYLENNAKIQCHGNGQYSSNGFDSPIEQLNIFEQISSTRTVNKQQCQLQQQQMKRCVNKNQKWYWNKKKVRMNSQLYKQKYHRPYLQIQC